MHGWILLLWFAATPGEPQLQKARDAQDRAELQRIAMQFGAAADQKAEDAPAQYRAALAYSMLAGVATELRDKVQARSAAEAGMKPAERAVMLQPGNSEYHRIWGTLCGQEVAAIAGLGALKYGKCAIDEVNKALELDPKSAINYVSHGVGSFYLPPAFGGGVETAQKDFEKAISLDPKLADAHLWLGMAFRKQNRDADARHEFEKALQLSPGRVWAKEQLEKTPH